MRKFKTDTSEMTNQVLFGETFVVLNKEKKWSYIKLVHDRYQGWISNKQYSPISFNIQNIFLDHEIWIDFLYYHILKVLIHIHL